jgi:hypothetical protein
MIFQPGPDRGWSRWNAGTAGLGEAIDRIIEDHKTSLLSAYSDAERTTAVCREMTIKSERFLRDMALERHVYLRWNLDAATEQFVLFSA